jgi:hypothetical protein
MPRGRPPFRVASVQFAYQGNTGVVPLRDPETMAFFGSTPEWTSAGARAPAAFVGGSRPRVRVVFQRTRSTPDDGRPWRLGAHGTHGHHLGQRSVRLTFGTDGLSRPVEFRFTRPMPRDIGELHREWRWYAHRPGRRHALGITRHLVYHTWRPPIAPRAWAVTSERQQGPFGNPDATWVYLPLMRWTCRWAAGRRSEKGICDAILANLSHTRMRYAVGAWNVGDMLKAGGGYCGGWYRMFQAMAGAQGVRVHRRAFLVDWRVEHRDIRRWCALVVSAPGLGRKQPAEARSTYFDSNVGRARRDPIQRFHVRRYRFWGQPGMKADGHCINFLRHHGVWYLYDACFLTKPVALHDFRLPPTSATRTIAVEHQGTFQRAYLNRAVSHLLGSLRHAGRLYKTRHSNPLQPGSRPSPTQNGLTVKTSIIPPRWRNITFYWMD